MSYTTPRIRVRKEKLVAAGVSDAGIALIQKREWQVIPYSQSLMLKKGFSARDAEILRNNWQGYAIQVSEVFVKKGKIFEMLDDGASLDKIVKNLKITKRYARHLRQIRSGW